MPQVGQHKKQTLLSSEFWNLEACDQNAAEFSSWLELPCCLASSVLMGPFLCALAGGEGRGEREGAGSTLGSLPLLIGHKAYGIRAPSL